MTSHPPQVMTIEHFREVSRNDFLVAQAHHGYAAGRDRLLVDFPISAERMIEISNMQNMERIKAQEGTK